MKLDLRIFEGSGSGLTFDFLPLHNLDSSYDRNGPDRFFVREEAFLFVEKGVAQVARDWLPYRHWSETILSRSEWLAVFDNLADLRADLSRSLPRRKLVERHLILPQFLPYKRKLDHLDMLDFLERLERRVTSVLESYPHLIIAGI